MEKFSRCSKHGSYVVGCPALTVRQPEDPDEDCCSGGDDDDQSHGGSGGAERHFQDVCDWLSQHVRSRRSLGHLTGGVEECW